MLLKSTIICIFYIFCIKYKLFQFDTICGIDFHMKLHEYLANQRKAKYKSVDCFLEQTGIDLSATKYYYYERGQVVPPAQELLKIIRALDLHPKYILTLWLYEHFDDETIKAYFSLPELKDDQKTDLVHRASVNDITKISPGHVDFFMKNRLAFAILEYLYINASDKLTIAELHSEFSKHKLSEVKKALGMLVEYGYLRFVNDRYSCFTRILDIPDTSDYKNLRDQMFIESIENFHKAPFETKYGTYPHGIDVIHKRTLDKDQHLYMTSLIRNLYNEYVRLEPRAGQEFSMTVIFGPFSERQTPEKG